MTADARTRLTGVLGHPVEHSLSPAIHNAALADCGINAVYLAFDVPPELLAGAVQGLASAGAVGVNVTVPHKEAALHLGRTRTQQAHAIGAANTLVFGADGISAHNTDAAGFGLALRELERDLNGRRCLVLGAGGAARAAVMELAGEGARVVVCNRTRERAERLAGSFGAEVADWERLREAVAGSELIVNATSVGLDRSSSPLDEQDLRATRAAVLLDMVYAPGETALVRRARAAGLKATDGLSMLVHQAALAFALFWGRPAPLPVMRRAAMLAAGRG